MKTKLKRIAALILVCMLLCSAATLAQPKKRKKRLPKPRSRQEVVRMAAGSIHDVEWARDASGQLIAISPKNPNENYTLPVVPRVGEGSPRMGNRTNIRPGRESSVTSGPAGVWVIDTVKECETSIWNIPPPVPYEMTITPMNDGSYKVVGGDHFQSVGNVTELILLKPTGPNLYGGSYMLPGSEEASFEAEITGDTIRYTRKRNIYFDGRPRMGTGEDWISCTSIGHRRQSRARAPIYGTSSVNTPEPISARIVINGRSINLRGAPIAILDGRIMVPMRPIFEAFDRDVTYDATVQSIFARDKSPDGWREKVYLQIGSTEATVRDKQQILELPPLLYRGHVLVPLSFIPVGLGSFVTVRWDEAQHTVYIYTTAA